MTRLLVVDDDADIRETMREILAWGMKDATVETAPSGEAALRMLEGDVTGIVTDYRMPGLNGIELAREARRVHPGIPIVLVTAFDDWRITTEAQATGINAILHKPFGLEALVSTVHEHVGAT